MTEPSERPSFGALLRARLPDLVDLVMVLVVVVCTAVAVVNRSFLVTGGVMAASMVGAALCFLLTSRSLRRCAGVGYERMFVAACAMAGGIWLFELVYHMGFAEWRSILGRSVGTFGLDLPGLGGPFPVLWALLILSTVFVGAKHMRVNRWFVFVGAGAAGVFALWLAVGFPNYFIPQRWPEPTLALPLIPPSYAHPTDPTAPAWAVVSAWGGLFATLVKLLVYMLPATLFVHHLGRSPASGPTDSDDVLIRAWKAFWSRLGRPATTAPPREPKRPGRLAMAIATRTAPGGLALRRARDFFAPKVADLADLAMVGVVVVCAALAIVRQSFLLTPALLAGSLIGLALCYLLVSRSLRSHTELGVRRVFISLCAMVSSMWLFEFVFHYWGWNNVLHMGTEITDLNLSAPWKPYPLPWSLMMVSLVFVGAPFMKVNRCFVIALAIAFALFGAWKAAGFPVLWVPTWWPLSPPILPVIPLEYAHAPTPEAAEAIRFWGGFFNTTAKVAWCVLPGFLFLTHENLGGSIRERVWPPGPALRRLFLPWKDWGTPSAEAGSASREGVTAPALGPAPAEPPSAPP